MGFWIPVFTEFSFEIFGCMLNYLQKSQLGSVLFVLNVFASSRFLQFIITIFFSPQFVFFNAFFCSWQLQCSNWLKSKSNIKKEQT